MRQDREHQDDDPGLLRQGLDVGEPGRRPRDAVDEGEALDDEQRDRDDDQQVVLDPEHDPKAIGCRKRRAPDTGTRLSSCGGARPSWPEPSWRAPSWPEPSWQP